MNVSSSTKTTLALLVVAAFLLATNLTYAYVSSWTAPAGTPSASNNTAPPINSSLTPQVKDGSLGVGGFAVFNSRGNTAASISASGQLAVIGDVSSPAFYYTSDERLKHNIQTIPNALSLIEKLRGVTFNWNATNRPDIGLIAQEVEKVIPRAVHTNPKTGYKSVEYANLVGPLIQAVKEQQQEIDTLKQQVKALQTNR